MKTSTITVLISPTKSIVPLELNPFEQHIMDEKADIKRFNNIFVTHRDRYIRFAYSYTYNQETAEDLVTESLMYYWENRHRLEEVKDIPLYILVTLKNKCLDYLQRERTWNNIAENLLFWENSVPLPVVQNMEACEPETLFSNEVQELVNQALAKLPEKSRHIFIMSRYEGKNYQTIAKETNLSVKSIEFHISKALNLLRKELKDYLPCLLFVVDFFYTP